jgi:hypothetical protein
MPTETVTTMLKRASLSGERKTFEQLTNLRDGDVLVEVMEWGGI